MHLTKGSGVTALYRATGSIAFPAVCRVVLGVAPDPNDGTGKRRLLLPVKFNIAPEATGIGYHIETTGKQILAHVDERDQPPILIWDNDPVHVDATSAMDRSGTVEERGALAETKRALQQIIADGPILSTEGMRQLKDAGASTSPTTVQRARTELGIESRKDGKGPWYWYPPSNSRVPRAGARARRESMDGFYSSESSEGKDSKESTKDSNGFQSQESIDFKDSSRTRARPWWIERELCPVHHLDFDEHECDAV
jgi:hypothetical protein